LEHPGEISPGSRKRIGKNGLHRAVCDHIASMTDRYVMREYDRIFGTKTDAI
jgi:dGTPase